MNSDDLYGDLSDIEFGPFDPSVSDLFDDDVLLLSNSPPVVHRTDYSLFSAEPAPFSDASQEFVPDFPTVRFGEVGSFGKNYRFLFESPVCTCRSGEPCRRDPASTYSYVFDRAVGYKQPELFRLSLWQAWEYPEGQRSSKLCTLPSQRRPSSSYVWDFADTLEFVYSVEARHCCDTDRLWYFYNPDRYGLSWLLHAKQKEGGGFRYFQYHQAKASISLTFTGSSQDHFDQPVRYRHHRVVELEFIFCSEIQGEAALPLWSPGFPEDVPSPEASIVQADIRYAHGGFLRFFR